MKNRFSDFDLDVFLNDPDVKVFIGKDFSDYDRLWRMDWAKNGQIKAVCYSYHWNSMAVFFSPIVWYAYRKMYRLAGILAALLCIVSLMDHILYLNSPFPAVTVGALLPLALMSRGFYFIHVYDTINKIKNLPADQKEPALREKGGTSQVAAILFGIGTIAALIGIEWIFS